MGKTHMARILTSTLCPIDARAVLSPQEPRFLTGLPGLFNLTVSRGLIFWKDGLMDGCMDAWMHGCMDGWIRG
jgi:hypothetical protein